MDNKQKDFVISLALVALGVYTTVGGVNIYLRAAKPPYNITDLGISPGLLPIILGALLLILSLVLFFKTLKESSLAARTTTLALWFKDAAKNKDIQMMVGGMVISGHLLLPSCRGVALLDCVHRLLIALMSSLRASFLTIVLVAPSLLDLSFSSSKSASMSHYLTEASMISTIGASYADRPCSRKPLGPDPCRRKRPHHGILPGLSATMAIALLTGLTYNLPTQSALIALLGVYVGSISGGCQSAILLNIPGTPASAATALDGFPMAKRGDGAHAIFLATTASMLGTLLSVIFVLTLTPFLTKIALKFASWEFFLLSIFGIMICGALTAQGNALKGWISGILGLLVAMIGLDTVDTAQPRVNMMSNIQHPGDDRSSASLRSSVPSKRSRAE